LNEAATVQRPPRAHHEPPVLLQVRESAQALIDAGKVDEAFELLVATLGTVLHQKRDLELLVAKLRKERVGKRSEKIDLGQLSLLFDEMIESEQASEEFVIDAEEEAQEDAKLDEEIKQAEAEVGSKDSPKRRRRRGGVRGRNVRKEVEHRKVPEEERTCHCGRLKDHVGEDISRWLEYVPAHIIEHEVHKEIVACSFCKDGVTTAEGPSKVIARSPASASLLAHLVVSKYHDHLPLHRLHRMYARIGLELPVSTMADWLLAVATLLLPVIDALAKQVLSAYVVRTDATGLKVLDHTSPENIERGTIWCYVGDDWDVLFRYAPTGEGASGPWEFLAGREGYVQADAANIFDRLFNGKVANAIELGCWSHGRRKFSALIDTDCRVAYPLRLIARLYRIEHLADARRLSFEERAALRKERSQPVLNKLKRWLVINQKSEPPSTNMAKAIAYHINHWEALGRFVADGRLSLDNNVCEQQMRDIALGRKNYLFAGSHQAAERSAVLYSLMRTCAQHKISPLPYLTDVITKISSGWPRGRIDELLPGNWKILHGKDSLQ